MTVSLNKEGFKYAKNLVSRGKVDRGDSWEFSADDGDRLLGPDGDDFEHFGKFHLVVHGDEPEDTKAHYGLPFGKNGKVYRKGVIAAKSRAAQAGYKAIEDAASELLASIDRTDSVDAPPRSTRTDLYDYREWQTEKMTRTPDGFLKGRAVVTNIGVFPYQNADGSIRWELRHPDDVFDPESIASLDGKPLTNDHPSNGVNPDSAKDLAVGAVHSPDHDAYHVTAGITIHRREGIDAVDGGKAGLSCGYDCDVVPEIGNYQGRDYTHRQKNIRYNHVALVDEGRAGDAARLRMDSVFVHTTNSPKGETMKIRLDSGLEVDVAEPVGIAFDAAMAKTKKAEKDVEDVKKALSEKEKELEAKKSEMDKLTAECDGLKSQIEAWETKYASSGKDSAIAKAVSAKLALLDSAVKAGAKVDATMSDRDIKAAVIALTTTDSMEGKSDDYVGARFDGALAYIAKLNPASEPGGTAHGDDKKSTTNEMAGAQKRRNTTLSTAWMGGKKE